MIKVETRNIIIVEEQEREEACHCTDRIKVKGSKRHMLAVSKTVIDDETKQRQIRVELNWVHKPNCTTMIFKSVFGEKKLILLDANVTEEEFRNTVRVKSLEVYLHFHNEWEANQQEE